MQRTKRKSTKVLPPEPWWGKTQKIAAAILGVCAVIGVGWNSLSRADARWAKDEVVQKEIKAINRDIAMLGNAFQYDQIDRAISNKQDVLVQIELRLKEKISPVERVRLEEAKRKLEFEIESLKVKQKKFQ